MRRIALIVLLLFVIPLVVSAQSGSDDTRARFRDAGYTVVRSRTQGGMPVWDLQTADGDRFAVHMIGRLNDDRVAAIDSLTEIVYSLDGLEVERVRIVFDETRPTEARASAIVIPETYVIDGTHYEEYMPSGMQFVYDDAPAFDFRMLIDNLAARINGAYLTEEQFRSRIQRAVQNPAAYIQSSDPQFLAEQIRELQRLVDTLEVQARELVATDSRLDAEIAAATAEGYDLLMTYAEEGEARITEVREDLEQFSAEVESALDNIVTENLTLTEEFVKMRRGSIILASRSLFGSLKEVPPETIAAVVELREADPEISADEARSQVNAALEEGEPQLHSKHVQAIYAIFFNDFE